MVLEDGDKAECKEIAREIVREVLIAHIECCPHGLLIVKSKALLLGACIGSGISGGGVVYALIHAISGI